MTTWGIILYSILPTLHVSVHTIYIYIYIFFFGSKFFGVGKQDATHNLIFLKY